MNQKQKHIFNSRYQAGYSDVVLRHTLPVFMGLGRCPIVNWDFLLEQ